MKFDNYIKLLTEAEAPEEAPEDDLNFDDEESQDLDLETGEEGPAASQSNMVNTPQEFELTMLLINALNYNGDINKKIYDDFEEQSNTEQILNYVESKVSRVGVVNPAIENFSGEEQIDTEQLNGKNISEKIAYLNQNTEPLQDFSLVFWGRLILNALKYDGSDYQVPTTDLTPESLSGLVSKIKTDFNYDTKGMFDRLVKSRTTGSSMSGTRSVLMNGFNKLLKTVMPKGKVKHSKRVKQYVKHLHPDVEYAALFHDYIERGGNLKTLQGKLPKRTLLLISLLTNSNDESPINHVKDILKKVKNNELRNFLILIKMADRVDNLNKRISKDKLTKKYIKKSERLITFLVKNYTGNLKDLHLIYKEYEKISKG